VTVNSSPKFDDYQLGIAPFVTENIGLSFFIFLQTTFFIFFSAPTGTWIISPMLPFRYNRHGRIEQAFDIGYVFGFIRFDSHYEFPAMFIADGGDFLRPFHCPHPKDSRPLVRSQFCHFIYILRLCPIFLSLKLRAIVRNPSYWS